MQDSTNSISREVWSLWFRRLTSHVRDIQFYCDYSSDRLADRTSKSGHEATTKEFKSGTQVSLLKDSRLNVDAVLSADCRVQKLWCELQRTDGPRSLLDLLLTVSLEINRCTCLKCALLPRRLSMSILPPATTGQIHALAARIQRERTSLGNKLRTVRQS